MIDLEQAKNEFERYSNTYDREDYKIERKHNHSLRVMEISGRLAEGLGLNEEEQKLAQLIGLLHDIGRYDQWTNYQTYNDLLSLDHGDKGAEILTDNDYIRWYITDDQYDDIIIKAVRNHNKYQVEEGLNETELMYANIVRDADKIDILYEASETFWIVDGVIDAMNRSYVSKDYYAQITDRKQIRIKENHSKLDDAAVVFGTIFDLNYKVSKEIILENDYINKIYNRFDFKMENTQRQMGTIKDLCDREIRK